ncbi:hypothetical protein IPL85_02585 [Candidatus Saccharibacteria bacterium]|nr:MAG: hypothetical protein IPL85_02585 [Candidatus Saccharibacteria bacterium]
MSNKLQLYWSKFALALVSVVMVVAAVPTPSVYAAACTPPGTNYGTVTQTSNISSAGTYRIWTRMAAANSTDNTVLLEIDGNTCYVVGGSSVPTYASGATNYFVNNKTNWISKTTGGTNIDVSFTTGNHTVKLIGNGPGVVIDRVLLTKDTTCTPTGTGSNCASIYFAADIDQNGSVNFLDFSRLASKYNQSGGGLGRTDINLDGTVSFLDLSLMANTYGQ